MTYQQARECALSITFQPQVVTIPMIQKACELLTLLEDAGYPLTVQAVFPTITLSAGKPSLTILFYNLSNSQDTIVQLSIFQDLTISFYPI